MAGFGNVLESIRGTFDGWMRSGEEFIAQVAQLISREELAAKKEAELVVREEELASRSRQLKALEITLNEREQKILMLSESADAIVQAALMLRGEIKAIIPAEMNPVLKPEMQRPEPATNTPARGFSSVVHGEGPFGPVIEMAKLEEATAKAVPDAETQIQPQPEAAESSLDAAAPAEQAAPIFEVAAKAQEDALEAEPQTQAKAETGAFDEATGAEAVPQPEVIAEPIAGAKDAEPEHEETDVKVEDNPDGSMKEALIVLAKDLQDLADQGQVEAAA